MKYPAKLYLFRDTFARKNPDYFAMLRRIGIRQNVPAGGPGKARLGDFPIERTAGKNSRERTSK
jgi:hypothetical protein